MRESRKSIADIQPRHSFLIGVDSDGCVFDTMEIKQKECFCPNNIQYFGLQAVSKYAREATEFINLYSKNRGHNRYLAIIKVMDLLARRREVLERDVAVPRFDELRAWTEREVMLSKSALRAEAERTGSDELHLVLAWSEAVDAAIEGIVKGVPPFPHAREALELASAAADILVVSQTPLEALEREWAEHRLGHLVRAIAGQEHGTKTEHLVLAGTGVKYSRDRVLMIGDAQGDLEAAQRNGTCFYPIIPGHEAESWKRFKHEGLNRFLEGSYRGDYERALLVSFDAALPESPGWL